MSTVKFHLPRTGYESFTKIIKAYYEHDKPAMAKDVAGVRSNEASRNVSFLEDIKVFSGGPFRPNELTVCGRYLAQALKDENEDNFQILWRYIVLSNDFLNHLVSYLVSMKRVQRDMLKTIILTRLELERTVDNWKSAHYIIEILQRAQLIYATAGPGNSVSYTVPKQPLEAGDFENVMSVINEGSQAKGARLPIKWLKTRDYSLAERLADFYGSLFLYENALRRIVNSVMENHHPNWWETKIKTDLPHVYKYAEDRKANEAKLPMIGKVGVLHPTSMSR